MNQRDYKEIARIIKETQVDKTLANDFKIESDTKEKIVNKLADYFEKERIKEGGKTHFLQYNDFNRKQFLADCGVD